MNIETNVIKARFIFPHASPANCSSKDLERLQGTIFPAGRFEQIPFMRQINDDSGMTIAIIIGRRTYAM
jgi:hypothetical protein